MEQAVRLFLVTLAAAVFGVPPPTWAWNAFVPVGGGGDNLYPPLVRFDAHRHVTVAGVVDSSSHSKSVVASLSRKRGHLRWSYTLRTGGENKIRHLIVDRHGDIVLAGYENGMEDVFELGYFSVIKLDSSTGAEQWHRELGPGQATGLAIDPQDDVVVCGAQGTVSDWPNVDEVHPYLAKLAKQDGDVVWQTDDVPGTGSLVVDANGDAVVAGGDMVAKYRGNDGTELWRVPAFGVDQASLVGRTDVVTVQRDFADSPVTVVSDVVVRSGEDGAERWRRTFVRFVREDNRFTQLPFIASGGGVVLVEPEHPTVEIVNLDALTGKETWRQRLDARGISSTVWEVVAAPHDLLMAWADGLVRLDPKTGSVSFRSFEPLGRSGVAVAPSGKVAMTEEDWAAGSDSLGFRVRTVHKHALRKKLRQTQPSSVP